MWCGALGAALLVVLCQARNSRTDELIDLRLQKACGQLCYTSAANLIGRRTETAPNASNVEQDEAIVEGRRMEMAPNFFQSKRSPTAGTRRCPVPEWKAHGFNQHETCGACSSHIEQMRLTACAADVVTDKVEAHEYHIMYGVFLLPLRQAPHPVKILEIGLGCDMHYEPGASASLWPKLLPKAEIWMAEHDAACVQESVKRGWLPGIHTLTGDQSDPAVQQRWIQESGGAFDAVIDDGGHSNWQIRSTFAALWPTIKPGGFYFVEDMQAGRNSGWPQLTPRDHEAVFSDIIQSWIEQLTIERGNWRPSAGKHPLPADVAFIACQREACVIAKACKRMSPTATARHVIGRRTETAPNASNVEQDEAIVEGPRMEMAPNFFQSKRIPTAGTKSMDVRGFAHHKHHSNCTDVTDDKQCSSWFFSSTALKPYPRQHDYLESDSVYKAAPLQIPTFATLVLFASCVPESSPYAKNITTSTVELLRRNVDEPFILAITCRRPMAAFVQHADAILWAPCAAARGYDSGLWQQGFRYALVSNLLGSASAVLMINDSVLGPLFKLGPTRPGVTFGAVWLGHVASSAMSLYGKDVIRSPTFVHYWNRTHFYCAKWGSMRFLEGTLAHRYQSAGFRCATWTADIDEYRKITVPPLRLPFYKHKNPPTSLYDEYVTTGLVPPVPSPTQPAPLIDCTTMLLHS